MKKVLLFTTLFIGSIGNSFGQCPAAEIAPWTDDVESMTTTTGVISQNCWSEASPGAYDWNIDGAGSTPSTGTGPLGANSGVKYFYIEASTTNIGPAILTTPLIDVSALTAPMVQFYYHMNGTAMGDLAVEAWDGATWNVVDNINGQQQAAQADPWLLRTIYLPTYTGVIQIRFIATGSGITQYGDMSIDDISIIETPTCPAPNGLTATNVLATSADIGYTDNSGAGLANIEYGPTGFVPGTGTTITGTTNNPESISGLIANTTYDFYVQSDCGGGDLSTWTGPFTFTTPCATLVAPWTDDIEAHTAAQGITSSMCWNASAPGVYDWNITGTGTTPSTGTGPNVANSGVKYFYIEASTTTVGPAVLTSPNIDVTALTLPMIEFYYHMHGTVTGDLAIEAWDGATWNVVDNINGEQHSAQTDPWTRRAIYLTGYTGVIQIRFTATGSGSSQYGDISIDDVSILEAPTCPEPSMFMLTGSNLTSADFSWNPIGSEVEWQLEYGTPGFTPETGFGTTILTANNPENIGGLTSNSFYEIYLQAVCSPGDTSLLVGPISFNTFNQGLYMDNNTDCPPAGFIDVSSTGTNLMLTDDSEAAITPLPFNILFQGNLMTNMTVGNNGGLQLGSLTAQIGYGGNFTTLADGTMFPWGDDLDSETGNVYVDVIGVTPNQVLIVQWDNSCNFSGAIGDPTVTFQIQIEEATGEIWYVYDDVVFGGAYVADDYGANADIGISGPNQDITVSTNDPQYLTDNSCVHFFYTDCPNPVNYTVNYTTNDEASISWNTGLYGETDWTVIYGDEGFDPATGGTQINTSTPTIIIPGLNDITTYDVYIYADCNPGVLQSSGAAGQFITLPNCSDPTSLAATSAVDSLITSWLWVESSGVGTYPSTGFNLQYGMNGFGLFDGSETIVNADNNFSDTTEDMTLLGGGVYEVYVQSVCNTDTSNWVGPVSFTMPISNDSTCNAIDLNVDGSVYTFDNTGATSQINEATIAPPNTGFQTSDGWGNSSVDFTTWFTFTAPGSGNMNLSGVDQGFNGQFAIYEASDCSDMNTFNLIGANDDALDGTSDAPDFSICGLTPGSIYYLMHDSWSTVTTGVYSIRLDEINLNAGTSNGIINICAGDTADLYDGISGYTPGGVWTEEIPTANFAGSIFPSAGLAFQVFNFEYNVVEGCATDSIIQQVEIYGPSSAGVDGSLTVCLNEPFDLLSGLSGNVDLGGQWYDSGNQPIGSAVTASFIQGSFNYDYITSNGVCEADTANIVVDVDGNCDYLNIQEIVFGNMEIYPNPTTGVVYISNSNSAEVFNFEITDLQGKVVATKNTAIN